MRFFADLYAQLSRIVRLAPGPVEGQAYERFLLSQILHGRWCSLDLGILIAPDRGYTYLLRFAALLAGLDSQADYGAVPVGGFG